MGPHPLNDFAEVVFDEGVYNDSNGCIFGWSPYHAGLLSDSDDDDSTDSWDENPNRTVVFESSDEEDDELTPSDHERTSGNRVIPPPPPNEVAEAEGSPCEHGLRLGSASNGRSPIGRPAEGARRSAQHSPSRMCISLNGS